MGEEHSTVIVTTIVVEEITGSGSRGRGIDKCNPKCYVSGKRISLSWTLNPSKGTYKNFFLSKVEVWKNGTNGSIFT